jgi:hypothetical protein
MMVPNQPRRFEAARGFEGRKPQAKASQYVGSARYSLWMKNKVSTHREAPLIRTS